MQFSLFSGTESKLHVLFDPSALTPQTREEEWYAGAEPEALRRETANGDLFAFSDDTNGEATWRILIDEEPGTALIGTARARTQGRLQVPSGRLWAAGAEYLDTIPEDAKRQKQDELPEGGGMCKRITPGTYGLEAFVPAPGEPVVSRDAPTPVLGILVSIVSATVVALLMATMHERVLMALVIGAWLVAMVVGWGTYIARARQPDQRGLQGWEEQHAKQPDVVVVLRSGGEDETTGPQGGYLHVPRTGERE
jgi:hypothetical protein